MTAETSTKMSEDTKSIITVIVLLLFYPLGLVLMWFWVNWPRWVKILITAPIVLGILGILSVMLLAASNPYEQTDKTRGQSEFYEQMIQLESNSKNKPVF